MIRYVDSTHFVVAENLSGFFAGWLNSPSPQTHLELLKKSDEIVVAIDDENGKVVGFITAITDKILSAYIPFLEVLPEYQKQGIGKELVKRMLEKLNGLYMIDLLCDRELQAFYEQFGMMPSFGMVARNYKHQAGVDEQS